MDGVKYGLPIYSEILKSEGISSTCFVTGQMAEQFPGHINELVKANHEIGCHGYSHRRFDRLDENEARDEIAKSRNILEQFQKRIISFRAPNLAFPNKYLPLLYEEGFLIDSSVCLYKPPFVMKSHFKNNILRVPATVTSSWVRLDFMEQFLSLFPTLVIFVHPWEFIDMSSRPIRFDCHFRTGEKAAGRLIKLIRHMKVKNYEFLCMRDLI